MARLELDKTRMMHEERRKTLSEETKHANQVQYKHNMMQYER